MRGLSTETIAAAATSVPEAASALSSASSLANVKVIGGLPDLSITLSSLDPASGSWYISKWMQPVQYLHESFGLEWWAAIAAVSVALRVVTMVPFFTSISTSARFQQHAVDMAKMSRAFSDAAKSGNKDAAVTARAEFALFMSRNGLKYSRIFTPVLFQAFIAVSFFYTLRRFASEAHLLPGFLEGGTGSFLALYAPDTAGLYFGLPFWASGAPVTFRYNAGWHLI
jgi:YidC/Oxa1 family membrane protein insertase